jgi:hypothetical protein
VRGNVVTSRAGFGGIRNIPAKLQMRLGLRVQTDTPGGMVGSFGSNGDFLIDASAISGGRFAVKENGNIGIGIPNPGIKN